MANKPVVLIAKKCNLCVTLCYMKIGYKQLIYTNVICDNRVHALIVDFLLIRENTGQIKPVVWSILQNLILKSENKVTNASSRRTYLMIEKARSVYLKCYV